MDTRVAQRSLIRRAGKRLEDRLRHVVGVAPVENLHVDIRGGVDGKTTQKFLHQLEGKKADRLHAARRAVLQVRPPAEIDHRAAKRLVHRNMRGPVPADAALVAKRPGKRTAQRDADILDSVVKIDLDIPVGHDLQVEEAMPREEREHVVEERNLRGNAALPRAVEREPDGDAGFGSVAFEAGRTGHHPSHSGLKKDFQARKDTSGMPERQSYRARPLSFALPLPLGGAGAGFQSGFNAWRAGISRVSISLAGQS